MFGLKDLIENAQNLQAKVASLQEELADRIVVGTSGGGMVTVEANGAQEIVSIRIEDQLVSAEDKEMLEDLVIAAVNDALAKSRDMVAQEVTKLTGGIKLPGILG